MHDLPLMCMTREIGTQISKTIGLVKEADVKEDGIGVGKLPQSLYRNQPMERHSRGRTINLLGRRVGFLCSMRNYLKYILMWQIGTWGTGL